VSVNQNVHLLTPLQQVLQMPAKSSLWMMDKPFLMRDLCINFASLKKNFLKNPISSDGCRNSSMPHFNDTHSDTNW